jgi:hypothetical protein
VDQFRAELRDALLGGKHLGQSLQSSDSRHIVAVCPDVLNDAEHAFGNLFQRMYHVTRVARDALGPYADRMSDTLQHLEKLLQLLFDYVSPVEIAVRPVDAARVVESLAAHFRERVGGPIGTPGCPSAQVLADTRTLGRSFQLLTIAFQHELSSASEVAIDVVAEEDRERVEFLIRVGAVPPPVREPRAALAWEVATRLIELQGGELVRTMGGEGCTFTVALPMTDGGHGTD